MSDETSQASGTQAASASEANAFRAILMQDRIAALEATVARLTAEPDQAEVEAAWDALDLPNVPDEIDIRDALTAFLERRMKG